MEISFRNQENARISNHPRRKYLFRTSGSGEADASLVHIVFKMSGQGYASKNFENYDNKIWDIKSNGIIPIVFIQIKV